jgi:ubiquinone/menaquinone biosynthesis C-methylase UbiE
LAFSEVDANGDSQRFIGYLDAARQLPWIARSKDWSFEHLHLANGQRALDVGCGTGEDVVAMAAIVGPTGAAVGLDSSQAMITEALKRHDGHPGVSFQVGDAHLLPFESESFDGCRMERTLQHLSDPDGAMTEITRVLKGGGRVALVDPDWETLVIEGSDPALSAKIWLHHINRHPQPRIGRRLRALLIANGFVEIAVDAAVVIHTKLEQSKPVFALTEAAASAISAGLVTENTGKRWLDDLEKANLRDQYLCALTVFRVAGRKPS